MKIRNTFGATSCLLLLASCAATSPAEFAAAPTQSSEATAASYERDRAAILAMAGEYRVSFRFAETVALRSDYSLKEPQRSGGTELVIVLENYPRRIVLQHILVMGDKPEVVKHWRQDWSYEQASLWEFRGERRWARRDVPRARVRGTWTQEVFEVDESPRYASYGRWVHSGRTSTWTSQDTWRPLPRREHTKRSDYDVLVGINRHIVTPSGWVHEQDNSKLDLKRDPAEPFIAKETGLNTYLRIGDHDFDAGRDYWRLTAPFWESVRAAWAARLNGAQQLMIATDVAGKPLMESMFNLADASDQPLTERQQQARGLIDQATQDTLSSMREAGLRAQPALALAPPNTK